ncbi:hypothetical protein PV416_38580 [Streptomyces ipomoeae]|jgi:hypothetical protein|nr:hypothetical protein [Streptomyces ipomoeae]MDX2699364.1 hypothetical protein [Streptomyces ipomoeae]MDX2826818.1 hypothetical protein [Streptomyces ipomoeae]MDX2879460.1 hypothetical protein [Streptomyces ipomoeae]
MPDIASTTVADRQPIICSRAVAGETGDEREAVRPAESLRPRGRD